MKKLQKILAMFLSFSMIMGLLCSTAFAEETEVDNESAVVDPADLFIYRIGTVDEDKDGNPDLKTSGVPKPGRYIDDVREYSSKHTIEYTFYTPSSGREDVNWSHNHNITSGLFNVVNSMTSECVPAYCVDFMISAVGDHEYQRINLEESTFFNESDAAKIRGIVQNGYWVDWSEDSNGYVTDTVPADVIDAVNAWLKNQNREPLSNLTADQALTATQLAVWTFSNASDYKYYVTPNFEYEAFQTIIALIKSVGGVEGSITNGKAMEIVDGVYAKVEAIENAESVQDEEEVPELTADEEALLEAEGLETYLKIAKGQVQTRSFVFNDDYSGDSDNTAEATANIEKFRDYLLDQEAEPLTRENIVFSNDYFVVSDAVFTESETSAEGTVSYTVTLKVKLAAEIDAKKDSLVMSATLGGETQEVALAGNDCVEQDSNGYYTVSFSGLTAEAAEEGMHLTLLGQQYLDGVYFYEAKPYGRNDEREASQNLVGRYVGHTPVFAEKDIEIDLGETEIKLIKYNGDAVATEELTETNTVKVSETAYYPPLAGVEFNLFAEKESTEYLVKTGLLTDENGEITVSGLPQNYTYFFREVESLPGYECDTEQKHQINNNGVVVVENCYDVGDLTVSKTVEGIPDDEHFAFEVELDYSTADLANAEVLLDGIYSVAWSGNNASCVVMEGAESEAQEVSLHEDVVVFEQSAENAEIFTATVFLKNGESLVISGIPTGTTYTVEELDSKGYEVESSGASGEIVSDSARNSAEAVFNNVKYDSDTNDVTVTVGKTVDDAAPGNTSFTFELYKWNTRTEEWNYVDDAQNDAEGNVAFELNYTRPGADDIYRVWEKNEGGRYVYDDSTYYARVKITSEAGVLVPEITYYTADQWNNERCTLTGVGVAEAPVFNNVTFKDSHFYLTGEKYLDNELSSKAFTFKLVNVTDAENPVEVATTTNSDAGVFQFDVELTEAGTYQYEVCEVAASGYVCDETVYTVTVTATRENGVLNVSDPIITVPKTVDGIPVEERVDSMEFYNTTNSNGSEAGSAYWQLRGSKTLDGAPAGGYTFQIADRDGDVIGTVTSKSNGVVTFPKQTYTKAGTYIYKVSEVVGDDAGIIYDSTVYTVKITVEKVDSNFEVTEELISVNSYTVVDAVKFENKTIPSNDPPSNDPPSNDPPSNDPPEEPPLFDVPDEEPPLAELPDEEPPLAMLPDEEVPLALLPATGDASALWMALSALSGAGLFVARKKRDEE